MIFFENTQCLTCNRELGWCPACHAMTGLNPAENGAYQCGHPSCGALVVKCHNYAVERVCNRCCLASDKFRVSGHPLCDYCRFNDTIPDLTVEGNREKWDRLEVAKRRLLYTLDLLQLPYGSDHDNVKPPLSFDFKADLTQKSRWWWSPDREERVYTGHANGKITINIREADHVEREKARVQFQEAHRTLVGHFRHEIAHYYWELLIRGQREDAFKAVFGDHQDPTYADAQKRYYANGPAANWQYAFVSAYASMHPWEDFAETFATYLDIVSVLDTANNMDLIVSCDPTTADFPVMFERHVQLGIVMNEMNRSMGLMDIVPEIMSPTIKAKLEFTHNLIRKTANAQASSATT